MRGPFSALLTVLALLAAARPGGAADPDPRARPGPLSDEDAIRERALAHMTFYGRGVEGFVLLRGMPAAQIEAGPTMVLPAGGREHGDGLWSVVIELDVRRDGDRALVYAARHPMPMADRWYTLFLRKVRGRWYVTGDRLDGLS